MEETVKVTLKVGNERAICNDLKMMIVNCKYAYNLPTNCVYSFK